MTMFGKVLVFVTLSFSILAVGFGLWAVVDPPDTFKPRLDALQKEIDDLRKERAIEETALRGLIGDLTSGSRPLPYDPEENLGTAPGGAPRTVKDSYSDIKALEGGNQKLFEEWNTLTVRVDGLINEIASTRAELQAALNESRRLREIIIPDLDRSPGQKTYRDTIADTRAGREESERRVETMRPTLVNEALRLRTLIERNEELTKRVGEVEKRRPGG
jgi:hypothetical protein